MNLSSIRDLHIDIMKGYANSTYALQHNYTEASSFIQFQKSAVKTYKYRKKATKVCTNYFKHRIKAKPTSVK